MIVIILSFFRQKRKFSIFFSDFFNFFDFSLLSPFLGKTLFLDLMSTFQVLLTLVALVAMVTAQTSAPPGTTSFTTYFSGGLPFCSQCGTAGQYACSPDANGVTLGNVN